jgi:hypothetical protein
MTLPSDPVTVITHVPFEGAGRCYGTVEDCKSQPPPIESSTTP